MPDAAAKPYDDDYLGGSVSRHGSGLRLSLSLAGIIASVSGVQILLRMRSEEMADRVEPLLAAPLSRGALFCGQHRPVPGAAGRPVTGFRNDDRGDCRRSRHRDHLQRGFPASLAVWIGVLLSFALTLLGPTFRLPEWALGISPFWHVPTVASEVPNGGGLLWILLATAVLVFGGFLGFRRRDLAR